MNRRELLKGGATVAAAIVFPVAAFAASQPTELVVWMDDVVEEAYKLGSMKREWTYFSAVNCVLAQYKMIARSNGQILHVRTSRMPIPMYGEYIADKISILDMNKEWTVVKDRSRII